MPHAPTLPIELSVSPLVRVSLRCRGFFTGLVTAGLAVQVMAAPGPNLSEGYKHLGRGKPGKAQREFARTAQALDPKLEPNAWAEAVAGEAQACLAAGSSCSAIDRLQAALAQVPGDASAAQFRLQLTLGSILEQVGRLEESRTALAEAAHLAEIINSPSARAEVALETATLGALQQLQPGSQAAGLPGERGRRGLNVVFKQDMGSTNASPDVLERLREAFRLSQAAQRQDLASDALLRLAHFQAVFQDSAGARDTLRQVQERLSAKSNESVTANQWLNCGLIQLALAKSAESRGPMGEATAALEQAASLALAAEDWSTLSYARGLHGQVLELQGQWSAAEAKTGEALFLAQRAVNQRALFEWQWQSARVLLAQGRLDSAKQFYRLATDTFRTIRGTLRAGRRSLLDYQSNPGDAFFELANLNFRLADDAKAPEQSTVLLRQARDAVEAYKSFEVESQFLSAECSALLENLSGNIEQVLEAGGKDAAILYVLPLEQRTELLVTLPGQKQERRSLAKGRKELEAVANRLRSGLAANRQRAEVQQAAETLYTDLIRPLETLLTENQIKQLVFVLDGALARVPMAALYDGQSFLIEKYAVANSPGLALMEPGRPRANKPTILLGALTTEEAGFSRLMYAQQEVEEIGREFRNVTLTGEQFGADQLKQALAMQSFNLVHLASHASFGGSAETTFVVVHGQRINLNALAELVRPTLLREQPIELLAFSACESARGNERLELGLAGVALKSGARSVLATLWEVEDRSIAQLMSEFYRKLAANPSLTKAEGLRAAQLSLLRSDNFSAPYFWAPTVLVGNWL